MKFSGTNLRSEDGTRPASRMVEVGSSLVVGGISSVPNLIKTEVLCDGSTAWEFGPDLPEPVTATYMTEHPDGEGVLLIAGNGNSVTLNTVYYLKDLSSSWYLFNTALLTERYGHIAMMLSCSNFNC